MKDSYDILNAGCKFHGDGNSFGYCRESTISTATKDIDQLACQLMEKLNERSTAMANGGQFQLALRDAEAIQFIYPSSSLGYLRAGTIYQQQGRQKEAVAIYQEGLVNVPSSDACYTSLQMQQADASNAANKRIDFISRLPLELVASGILPLVFHRCKLEADVPCPYLYVSRTWRQRILNCNNLSFRLNYGPMNSTLQFRELERFAPHVKKLRMDARRAVSYEDPLLIFGDFHFLNLTHFNLNYAGYEDYIITSALRSVQHSLTHLKLYTEKNYTLGIDLDRVLDDCPNLVSLDLATWTILHLTVQHPKLTHLTLQIGIDPLPKDKMINVLSHLPSLVFLDLFLLRDHRFVTALSVYCPKMKILRCIDEVSSGHDSYDERVDGLQKLYFGAQCDDEPYDAHGVVIQILLEHKHSLDHVTLAGSITDASGGFDGPVMDSTFQFDRLQELVVDARNEELVKLALSIIHRSPHLCTITMDHLTATDDGVCNAVKRLPNLRMITAYQMPPDAPSFQDLLIHHAQLGMGSSLKELNVTFEVDSQRFPWISALAELQTLEKLVLSTWHISAASTYLSILGIFGKVCPSLTSLDLDFWDCTIPDGSVTQIKHHPTLQRLCINASSISDSDLISLLSFPSLKHVIIIPTIKGYLLNLLQTRISRVEQRHP
ncbi:hypothetical protein O0I10_006303 [Lichtheimia ornata]|uniref:F-box domain-containing protein n=1 Tax=Lichtheimia ornata TaxID=688661 RepID=A0AAD7V2T6_9FUNG|nr:uncharacterized protein O0I10_006303 [Lichtheimia ornata]KAJ8658032.1 hypothetical protein O0I10_006303 [Lichtheimia ornata]